MALKTLKFLLICCLFLTSKMALASGDLILEKSYFEDPQKSLKIDQITHQHFENFSGIFNRGYGQTFYWFKLKINAEKIDQTVLKILPTFLDEIEVYIPQKNGAWLIKKTGDRYAFNDRDRSYTSFAVDLKNINPANAIIYVKLNTISSNLISFEALNEKQLAQEESTRDIALGAYFGLLLVLIIWSIHGTYKHKNAAIAAFGAFEIVELIYAFALMGYLSRFALPDNPLLADYITSFTVISHIFFGTLFHCVFLKKIQVQTWLLRIQYLLASIYLGLQVSFLMGFKQFAIIYANFLVLVIAFNLALVAYFSFKSKVDIKRQAAFIYLLLFVSVLASISPYIGIIQAIEASLYASLFNSLISSILLYVILHRQEKQLQEQLSTAVYEAQHEKEQHQQQSRFMAMLTHEIKTPLSALRLTVGSMTPSEKLFNQAEGAIADIDQIIERCRQADQLEQKKMVAHIKSVPIEDLLTILRKYISPQVTVQCDFNPEQAVTTDPFLWEIIVSNLVQNAKKYAPAQSMIEVHMQAQPNADHMGMYIQIRNQIGKAGAPKSDRLFEKYHREPSAHNTSGSGLGLFIVKSCVDILHGKIEYRSDLSLVEFHLWLP